MDSLAHRLTNVRYADDVLLFAKSLSELRSMTEILITELRLFGLELNCSKTKILHTEFQDEENMPDFVEIDNDFIEVLHGNRRHRYLGRRLSLHRAQRVDIEFNYRKQQAWASFHKHKKVLLNQHVALGHRLKYFDACVTPTMILALSTLPAPK